MKSLIFDEILNKRLKQESSLSKDYSQELDENNTFKYVNPECPKCGSHKIIKKGTITKEKQNILGKTIEFKEQQYQCKTCKKSSESRIKQCLMMINTLLKKYLIKYLK